jgi:uncharacterized membrane protein
MLVPVLQHKYSNSLQTSRKREYAAWSAAALYILAGSSHFLQPEAYAKIVPPWVPWHVFVVYVSGAAEIAGGVGLLIGRFRRPAALGLIALLATVFPANIYMAVSNVQVTSTPIPNWVLWARLPVQLLLVWWLLFLTGPGQEQEKHC